MPELSDVISGLSDAFTLINLFYIVMGVMLGQIVGAIPGLSILMALAIAIPLTYAMDALHD